MESDYFKELFDLLLKLIEWFREMSTLLDLIVG